MSNKNSTPQQVVRDYFNSAESRLGYAFLLKGRKHFGYYPLRQEHLTKLQAQLLMEDRLAQKLALPGGSLALDAGCGEGKVAIHLAETYGLRVAGVDLLDWAIQKARKNAREAGTKDQTTFTVMDYSTLSFSDMTFDGVYTMETLVHVPDYRDALRQFHRTLKPGGKVVLFEYSVAPEEQMPQHLKPLWRLVVEQSGMHSLPWFTHGVFPGLLAKEGFADVVVENVTSRVLPMVEKFYSYAYYPYKFISAFGLQRHFINTVAGYSFKEMVSNDVWRYNIISAVKPA
ncbi:MAG TPA: methyltransferase domain-containing protein [Ktedonobacterales bacterium]|jgi:ubiquinone/menaquinone biosynthesis C-methylase UbiE